MNRYRPTNLIVCLSPVARDTNATGEKMDADTSIAPPTRLAVTPDVAAEITGRTRTRIFEAIRKQELTARKDGKATVIEADELLRWLRSLPTRGRRPTMVECGGRDRWLP